MRSFVALAFIVALTGCEEPYFTALNAPPPTKVAELDSAEKTIEISTGVALAFDCKESSSSDAPCERAKVSVESAAIATVSRVYLADLSEPIYDTSSSKWVGKREQTAFVVVGRAAGKTTLRVDLPDEETIELGLTVRP